MHDPRRLTLSRSKRTIYEIQDDVTFVRKAYSSYCAVRERMRTSEKENMPSSKKCLKRTSKRLVYVTLLVPVAYLF